MQFVTRIIALRHTLQGKLIFTYTAVTVLALLALEITVVLFLLGLSQVGSAHTFGYLSDVIAVLAPQARPYLQPGAQNLDGLQTWLQTTYDAGYASLPPRDLFDHAAAEIIDGEPMYVIAPDKTILAAAPATTRALVGTEYSPPAHVTLSNDILHNALQLDLQSGHVSAMTPDGNYLIAVPVRQSQGVGPLVAVVMVTVKPPPARLSAWWPVLLTLVPATGIMLLIAVIPFGALFGFVMSRGLSRRLQNLHLAVDAWSEGDFSTQPHDRSRDEIGDLSERLRRMAEHIQTLLQTQQALALLEERNRLARDLHDSIKQEAFATLMQVRAAQNLLERDPASARAHLAEAEKLIKTSQQELGLIISELRPAALQGQGLAPALSNYLETWSHHARIPADLDVQNAQPIPLEIEQTLFRITQEALSNVARHSHASAVTIRLSFAANQASLCIVDNGVGFDPAAVYTGFGLQSMRDRVEAIGGQMHVQTNPTQGTVITVSVPTFCREQT